MKQFIFLIIVLLSTASVCLAQVSDISAKLNETEDKFIITYTLEKGETGYWDVQIIAFIDDVRIDPSRAALFGDTGQQIRHGKNRRIIWDAFIDVESIDGEVRFEVSANKPPIAAPPSPSSDFVIGGVAAAGGLGLIASGLPNLLKKQSVDANANATNDPITYYYTFCDAASDSFDASQVITEQSGQASACDQHFIAANDAYKSASVRTVIGSGLLVAGGILILTKPFHKHIQMSKYLKDNGLSLNPNFEFTANATSLMPQASMGLRLTYTIGK